MLSVVPAARVGLRNIRLFYEKCTFFFDAHFAKRQHMSVNPFAALILKVNDLEAQIASLGGTQSAESSATVRGANTAVQGVIRSSQDALTIKLVDDQGQTHAVFGSPGLDLKMQYSGLLAADGKSFEVFSARVLLSVMLIGEGTGEYAIATSTWNAFLEMGTSFVLDGSGLTGEKLMAWAAALNQARPGLFGNITWLGYPNINRAAAAPSGSTAIPILSGASVPPPNGGDDVPSLTQMYIDLGDGIGGYQWKNIYTKFLMTPSWQAQWQLCGPTYPLPPSPTRPLQTPFGPPGRGRGHGRGRGTVRGGGLTAALRNLPVAKHFLRGRGS